MSSARIRAPEAGDAEAAGDLVLFQRWIGASQSRSLSASTCAWSMPVSGISMMNSSRHGATRSTGALLLPAPANAGQHQIAFEMPRCPFTFLELIQIDQHHEKGVRSGKRASIPN